MPPGSTPFSRRAAARCRRNSCCCASRPSRGVKPTASLWGKLMALQLGGNYRGELLRASMARTISPADLAFLYPGISEGRADNPGGDAADLSPAWARPRCTTRCRAVGPHYASNNWVVDGKHSASGKPLLANDPHLGFGAPGLLVSGAAEDAGAGDRRRHRRRRPARRDRPQRPHRLGLHDDDRRCRGSVHRKARPEATPAAI